MRLSSSYNLVLKTYDTYWEKKFTIVFFANDKNVTAKFFSVIAVNTASLLLCFICVITLESC